MAKDKDKEKAKARSPGTYVDPNIRVLCPGGCEKCPSQDTVRQPLGRQRCNGCGHVSVMTGTKPFNYDNPELNNNERDNGSTI